MKPAEASSDGAVRARTDDEKCALITEYDDADYKGRYVVLDREQITIRDISRWRSETRPNSLRVADNGTATTPRRPSALRRAPAVTAAPPEPAAPEPISAPEAPAAKATRATKRATRKEAVTTPALRARSKRSSSPAKTPAKAPAAPVAKKAPSRAAPTTVAAQPEPTAQSAPASRRSVTAASSTSDVIARRHRRRASATDAAATALRDAALTHADQIIHHAEALERMLSDDAWQTVAATAGTTAPDSTALGRQVRAAAAAAAVVRASLAASGPQRAAAHDADQPDGRGRRPWWGGAADNELSR